MKPAVAIAIASVLAAQQAAVENAWHLIAQGRRDQAVAILREVIQADARNADARLLLGSVLMEAGQRTESIEQLSEAVRLRPKSAEAHNALGEAYNAFNEANSAQHEFERAIAVDPAFARAHVNLASLLLPGGHSAEAAAHLDRAIALMGRKPDAADAHYLRAKIYSERRDPAKAAAELELAVALAPEFAEAWSDLGEARRSLLDDAKSLAAFERAVQLAPDGAVARTRLGLRLLDLDRAHDAVPHLREAARLDPKNQSTLNALQLALRRDGQLEEANAVRRQLAQLIHERDQADQNLVRGIELNNRGAELEKTGDLRGALEKYRAALELLPEHAGIRTNVGAALLKLGQWDEGIAQLREALRRDPDNAALRRALDDALARPPKHSLH